MSRILRKLAELSVLGRDLDFRLFLRPGRLLQLDVARVLVARSRRNKASHDDIFLQPPQIIHFSVETGLGQDAGRLLEGGRGDEAVCTQGALCDTKEEGAGLGRLAAFP